MGTYIYLTSEKKVHDKWELFAPMQLDYEWDNQLCPPLILDGGWPSLAHDIIDTNKNWRLPVGVSAEFKSFYTTQIKNEGWGYS